MSGFDEETRPQGRRSLNVYGCFSAAFWMNLSAWFDYTCDYIGRFCELYGSAATASQSEFGGGQRSCNFAYQRWTTVYQSGIELHQVGASSQFGNGVRTTKDSADGNDRHPGA